VLQPLNQFVTKVISLPGDPDHFIASGISAILIAEGILLDERGAPFAGK
jgi:hypothetical protein